MISPCVASRIGFREKISEFTSAVTLRSIMFNSPRQIRLTEIAKRAKPALLTSRSIDKPRFSAFFEQPRGRFRQAEVEREY